MEQKNWTNELGIDLKNELKDLYELTNNLTIGRTKKLEWMSLRLNYGTNRKSWTNELKIELQKELRESNEWTKDWTIEWIKGQERMNYRLNYRMNWKLN